MIYEAAADDTIRALVLRIDSPGGSVLASEQMRVAIQSVKAKGKPVIVSMANVAASGGYWISTPADVIFAEPSTITGSIGVFGVLPTFEGTLGQLGVSTDGAEVAPLSGQPDLFGGTNETFDRVAQAGVEQVYDQFLGLVATSRKKDKAAIDAIAQGRVWSGGQARQNGLIDRFGGLDDALAEAAKRAKLGEGEYYAAYFEQEPSLLGSLLSGGGAIHLWHGGDARAAMQGRGGDIFTFVRAAHIRQQSAALASLHLLLQGQGVQAMCVTCLPMRPAPVLDTAVTSRLGGLLNAQSALSSR